jgi:hypothetical protein
LAQIIISIRLGGGSKALCTILTSLSQPSGWWLTVSTGPPTDSLQRTRPAIAESTNASDLRITSSHQLMLESVLHNKQHVKELPVDDHTNADETRRTLPTRFG